MPDTLVGAPGTVPTMPKLWSTCAAGRNAALPAWLAAMVQVPKVSIVTFEPTIEQTDGVLVVSATVRPEEALAVSTIGVELNGCVPGFEKVMN